MQGPPSESADSTGSEANTPNTVYAREVAQLFVSGRHSQFRDSSRFGSLDPSRTLSSARALQHAPTPSLPSSESIGQACMTCFGLSCHAMFKCDLCQQHWHLAHQYTPSPGLPSSESIGEALDQSLISCNAFAVQTSLQHQSPAVRFSPHATFQ